MRSVSPASALVCVSFALACAPSAMADGATATTAGAGGAPAPSSEGGTQYGAPLKAPAPATRPVATVLGVTSPLSGPSATPRIVVRFDERGVRAVHARVVVLRLPGGDPVARIVLGRVPTGRNVRVPWPRGIRLAAGQYLVRVHAKDRWNHNLRRLAHASGRTTLVVRGTRTPAPAPTPAAPAPAQPAAPEAGSVVPGGVFPVAGAHSYGDVFGTPRKGYSHQGQDVLGTEGTPIVAPVAGTITVTSYQAGAAGYYVVEQAGDGRSFFFAHCQKDTFGVEAGQVVAAGAPLCNMGHTGDATGPHLHFEEWLGGWRVDSRSHPVDPLPQLKAWDR